MGVVDALFDWLAAHTYVVAFAGALIDATGLPFPGRLLLVAAGAVTAAQGYPVAVVIVLGAAGASLSSVVRTTVFLRDMGEFAAMNEVYSRHFVENKPARATVQAAGLPRGARVEIECIAVV